MVVKGLIERDAPERSPSPIAGAPCCGQCWRTCDDDSEPAMRGVASNDIGGVRFERWAAASSQSG
jgi:hypothetical protein